jgi:hypothetical protein
MPIFRIIVDTNVPATANHKSTNASTECVNSCIHRLKEVMTNGILVIDDKWLIIQEYKKVLNEEDKLRVGNLFLKWVLRNRENIQKCEKVSITQISENVFAEFPNADTALEKFDPSDRKFVAVALTHPDKPPILNAMDSDWKIFETVLTKHGLVIENLCLKDLKQT